MRISLLNRNGDAVQRGVSAVGERNMSGLGVRI